uniref:Uncharacterized protein n=1 Tax=Neisseria meningitidis alpha522 TaxID=996307 RepID=I4E508_NEIME|nr:hypothetical protein NMALPHA522_0883 [Neisseria meningitidis alpha522]
MGGRDNSFSVPPQSPLQILKNGSDSILFLKITFIIKM